MSHCCDNHRRHRRCDCGAPRNHANVFNPPVPPPNPPNAWTQASAVGDTLYVAGQRGRRQDGTQPADPAERIRLAFRNMLAIAEFFNSNADNTLRNVIYLSNPPNGDYVALRALVNQIQAEFYGNRPPPRTILGVEWLNQDDIFEIEGTFYIPPRECDGRPFPLGPAAGEIPYPRDA